MPLSEDEERCVLGACRLLTQSRGGTWAIVEGDTLDDLYPNSRSPEVLVSNGRLSAAIEVTGLRGGLVWNDHSVSLKALRVALQPSRPGFYMLNPAIDFRLPIGKRFVGQLKQQIELASDSIHDTGDRASVLIPRSAEVRVTNLGANGYVFCSHQSMNDVLRLASEQVDGEFWLVDDDQLEHSFRTDEGRFVAAEHIAAACRRAALGQRIEAKWDDEWELTLVDPSQNGVRVLSVTEAVSVPGMVTRAVTQAVAVKRQKFSAGRWADLHVLVMDAQFPLMPSDDATFALSQLDDEELAGLDLVMLAHHDETDLVWDRGSRPAKFLDCPPFAKECECSVPHRR